MKHRLILEWEGDRISEREEDNAINMLKRAAFMVTGTEMKIIAERDGAEHHRVEYNTLPKGPRWRKTYARQDR
jgi:hypothetical protein